MSDIFLSYAVADGDRAEAIVQGLRAAGYSVWWDRDIQPGQERKAAIAEAMEAAKLCLAGWSRTSVDHSTGQDVIDEAEAAKGRGAYLGVLLDKVELPFGFGGYDPIDVAPFNGSAGGVAAIVQGVRDFMEKGQAAPAALPPPPPPPKAPVNKGLIVGIAVAVAMIGAIAFFLFRSAAPTLADKVEPKLAEISCAWLHVDPVRTGEDGRIGLIGVAGDPAAAQATVIQLAQAEGLAVQEVVIDKVAQIDPRECPAIDEPRRLRKSPGGRLRVTGEPFFLDPATKQSLARVEITLDAKDKSIALFGVEPSGVVTWALPDATSIDALKDADVGLVKQADGKWEFNIYPDHLGWTGLFVVVGDRPLAKAMPQGTVQGSAEFASTLREATAGGEWDADMVWFRIDPK
ncbi:TIR domain-containing protein [Sphingomonas laterariae]|uniref:TIR domain-containing protein n=1 Tax=Edaphosphingomonas laterariae TaxID=861865 RepID=A0A239DHS6_9SPHN|nr:toll/interleukin-1 receptor domain-containing protein [Sphingomonas laterariae]SNS31917.1 TIR domain-containing protein [Sphingomonas laterariae]